MVKSYAPKPKRPYSSWMDFILGNDGKNIPAVVESLNNGSGMIKGQRFLSWDFEGNYFAIHNSSQNQVWCHRKNFNVLSSGTLNLKGRYPDSACVEDYLELVNNWQDVVILRFDSARTTDDGVFPQVFIERKDCNYEQIKKDTHNGSALMMKSLEDAKQAILYVMEFFPEHLADKNPCFEHIQVSVRSAVDSEFFMTAERVWDSMVLMTAVKDAPAFTSKEKHVQRARVDAAMNKAQELDPSTTLMGDNGRLLRRALTTICELPKVTDSFERLLKNAAGEVSMIHRNAGIYKYIKPERDIEKPETPQALENKASINYRR